ncbi:MAG: DUF1476 domain-containing protein [Alphaproteobacteria bacterium]
MTGFDDRKDAMERKYAHEEKMSFEIEARTSKLFGLWAAEQMGITGADADVYAKEVVIANLEEAGFDDIIRKVRADFDAKGIEMTDHMMQTQVELAHQEARKQILENL